LKKAFEVTLGIVTSVGGFLEIGCIATASQAGALFGFQLLWAVVLGGICVAFIVEQSGRLAAISGQTIVGAIRERFGFGYYALLLASLGLVALLVLAAELGGVSIALEFATGISYRWWAVPVALVTWLVLWRGKFGWIEQGVSVLGLVTTCFIVAAFKVDPAWGSIAHATLPTLPEQDTARYWFLAVSILGAIINPTLFFFYSAGALEDKWDKSYIGVNRAVAGIGMAFGTVITAAVLIVAAMVLLPRDIKVEDYWELPLLLKYVFGRWGVPLMIASLAVACLGAALEVALMIAYMAAQGLGWNWSENPPPRKVARFALLYTVTIVVSCIVLLVGPDPLQLTIFSMVLSAATLPIAVVPFLFIMNDKRYLERYTNGVLSNGVVLFVVGLAFVMAIVALPLQIFGGG
jgi:Mn2+/Fe2+ NRAMP family transporter